MIVLVLTVIWKLSNSRLLSTNYVGIVVLVVGTGVGVLASKTELSNLWRGILGAVCPVLVFRTEASWLPVQVKAASLPLFALVSENWGVQEDGKKDSWDGNLHRVSVYFLEIVLFWVLFPKNCETKEMVPFYNFSSICLALFSYQ
jgi:hypothetical protein